MKKGDIILVVGLASVITLLAVQQLRLPRMPIPTTSPVKMRWDTPTQTPDRYRIYLDGLRIAEIAPPGGPVGCRCQQVEVPVPEGPHRIALRSVYKEMESPAAEVTVVIAK